MNTSLALLFCLGLFAVQMTKIRFFNSPIGFGEILLVLWIALSSWKCIYSRKVEKSTALSIMAKFWLCTFLLLGAGWWIASDLNHNSAYALHNLFAYLFVSLICLTLLCSSNSSEQIEKLVLHIFIVFGGACLLMLIYMFWCTELFGMPLFQNSHIYRLTGLSTNPNQLSLYVVFAPFICIAWFLRSSAATKTIAVLFFIAFIIVGYKTHSEALNLAWAFAFILLLLMVVTKLLLPFINKHRNKYYICILLFGVMVITLFAGPAILEEVGVMFEKTYASEKNQGGLRMLLLENGVNALKESPYVGLGPGSFSGLNTPFSNKEVHNTPLDWATQTGVVGLLLLIGLVLYAMRGAWRSGRHELISGFIALIIFAQFHFVLRQPLVWVIIIFVMVLPPASKASSNNNV